MSRTKLKDRILPDYTHGEELFNMISHIVGGGLAVLVALACVVMAAWHGNVWGVVSGAIYGFTMIVLYTMSSVYHGLRSEMAKKVFQVIDHCTIYFLIAGTYTPITLTALRPTYPVAAWIIFGIVWGCAALAATLTAIDLHRYRVFSMICYIAMGWCIIFWIKPTIEVLTPTGALLILLGGIAYTIGAILYGLGKKHRYMHAVFHLFVIAGSLLQFFAILLYVMPYKG